MMAAKKTPAKAVKKISKKTAAKTSKAAPVKKATATRTKHDHEAIRTRVVSLLAKPVKGETEKFSTSQVATKLGIEHRLVKQALSSLCESRLVSAAGKNRGRVYEITAKGKAVV